MFTFEVDEYVIFECLSGPNCGEETGNWLRRIGCSQSIEFEIRGLFKSTDRLANKSGSKQSLSFEFA